MCSLVLSILLGGGDFVSFCFLAAWDVCVVLVWVSKNLMRGITLCQSDNVQFAKNLKYSIIVCYSGNVQVRQEFESVGLSVKLYRCGRNLKIYVILCQSDNVQVCQEQVVVKSKFLCPLIS